MQNHEFVLKPNCKFHDLLEFEIGGHVWLRVMPIKGVRRFGVIGKLSPRYIGPFEILR